MTITVAPALEPIGQLLTAQEYDALPENSLRELVDGVIHMMATPTPWHQDVKIALTVVLKRLAPREFRVTGEVEVRLSDSLRRNPDVLVVHAAGYDRSRPTLRPDQVLLAVEVVSPGSESTDRILKPVEYARAGIGHYWLLNIDGGVEVNTFRLADDGSYLRTGIFGPGDTVQAPGLGWAQVKVDELADGE